MGGAEDTRGCSDGEEEGRKRTLKNSLLRASHRGFMFSHKDRCSGAWGCVAGHNPVESSGCARWFIVVQPTRILGIKAHQQRRQASSEKM